MPPSRRSLLVLCCTALPIGLALGCGEDELEGDQGQEMLVTPLPEPPPFSDITFDPAGTSEGGLVPLKLPSDALALDQVLRVINLNTAAVELVQASSGLPGGSPPMGLTFSFPVEDGELVRIELARMDERSVPADARFVSPDFLPIERPSCLSLSRQRIQLELVEVGIPVTETVRLENTCADAVVVQSAALVSGNGVFMLTSEPVVAADAPAELAQGSELQLDIELETTSNAPLFEVLLIQTEVAGEQLLPYAVTIELN